MSEKETTSTTEFVPPRHWVGPEELEPGYWANAEVMEKRGQEFYEKPLEWLDRMDRSAESSPDGEGGMARREFLTVMGASMAMASLSCARRPVHKIIPYVVKPEETTPGIPTWYASVSKECPCGCGILVKTRESRPIKLEGNPDHPLNRGALCGRAQAAVLNLYDPDRLTVPVSRLSGRSEMTWDDADKAIGAKLRDAASGGGRVRVLTGCRMGPSTARLITEFLAAFRGGAHVEFDPIGLEEVSQAQARCYGTELTPSYNFAKAETIVSLGADFLGTWISPIEHAVDWAKGRKVAGQGHNAKQSKFYCFEPTMTVTGANADERFAVRPGDELSVALALASEIVSRHKPARFSGDSNLSSLLSSYPPGAIEKEIGLPVGIIGKVAGDLWEARGKGLVVGGGIASRAGDALSLQIAINLLNSMLDNDGATVDGTMDFRAPIRGFSGLAKLAEEMRAGSVDVLIVHRANPLYTLPRLGLDFDAAMKKVPLVIMVSDREDETAASAHYVLPDHHFLENWGDDRPRQNLYALQQPTIAPLHSTRAFEDDLLSWIRAAGLKASGLASRVAGAAETANTWHDYLKANWEETLFKTHTIAGNFEQFWEGSLRRGVFDSKSARMQDGAHSAARAFQTGSITDLPHFKSAPSGILLSLYPKISLMDGRHANNPWLQELPDPISTVTWDNYLNVGPATATKLGIRNDDVVEVSSGDVSVRLPVRVQPGMHPSAVSVAIGYGRRAAGKVGTGAGVDVYPFVRALSSRLVYSGQPVSIRRTQEFYRLAALQWHNTTENRPVVNDLTLAEFRANPASSNETEPKLKYAEVPSIWPAHEYTGYRWGMTIDLSSCIGCGACTVACQAENNVPVVGRQQVRNSRHMAWIRIDRYYSGSAESPQVVFQPMLCQHCENAPCETVCPVLATVHDSEGLNVQVYNRCVGTRYCQNNCPYKVRRFNFFDHWKAYEGTMNLAWNPDVTVRTRGIMEKCTFCVQRIRESKDKAKDLGAKVVDGDLKTACQQTCPTEAIVFGDVNDPGTRVSRLRNDDSAFRALETLNAKPMVSYLTKVRNVTVSGREVQESAHSLKELEDQQHG